MTLLHVEQLAVGFGSTQVVKKIGFEIGRGEMLAVVGESGSGKSLSALACLGLLPGNAQVSGSVRFDGQELMGASEDCLRNVRGARISMIFQEPMTALNPLHTIGKQIAEILTLHQRMTAAAVAARVAEVLEQVGLGHFVQRLDAYPHQLSGGERQRVMIAMAIANKPDLLIADEPTTAVDVTVQAKILLLLKQLQKDLGMAMLFITHDLTLVKRLADRVAVMRHGEIVEQGVVSGVFGAPKHAYTQQLLGSEPKGSPLPPPGDAKEVVGCEELKVHFPIRSGLLRRVKGVVKAIDGVTISVTEGMTLGLVGESGSGKTTLGFALLRLLASEGRVAFLGHDIQHLKQKELRPLRQQMQMVFQDPYASLNPRMSVMQIIEEGLLVHEPSMDGAARAAAVAEILEEVGLEAGMAERYPHEFSGGQRQRISIARAMVLKPRFVVLDEPTSALDLTVQAQMVELLKDLQLKYRVGYLFISHDLRVVRAISHRVVVMRQGQVVEEAQTAELFAAPREAYTQALIKAALMEG